MPCAIFTVWSLLQICPLWPDLDLGQPVEVSWVGLCVGTQVEMYQVCHLTLFYTK